MNNRVLHVCSLDKFIPPFIDFINREFGLEVNYFWLHGDHDRYPVKHNKSIYTVGSSIWGKMTGFLKLIKLMNSSKKIILHGLFDPKRIIILFFMPWLLKKCYWVVWGGDLYAYKASNKNWKWKVKEFFRRPVLKKIGFLVTYIPGDVELARKWYGAEGTFCECLMYLSNVTQRQDKIYSEGNCVKSQSTTNFLLGNSASPTNNHLDALDLLLPYRDARIKIYTPLSYGDHEYAEKVISKGKHNFGDKFIPLTKFMHLEQYLVFLDSIDIAIFNHDRQQGMGNTITLLGMGKTVYMRPNVSHFDFLTSLGLHVYDIHQLSLELLERNLELENVEIANTYFSIVTLKKQLVKILGE